MTKTNIIQLHLIEKKSITSWEAIKEYGVTRLSDIIFRLRNAGMNIRSEREAFIDRYGNKSYFVRYILEDHHE